MKRSFLILMCVLLTVVLALSFTACNEEETPEHTHTYAETWTNDATGHWYAASCEHTDEKANFAVHADANKDGICDVCNYVTCEHEYNTEAWESDAEKHWNPAKCGCNVKGNEAAHVGMEDGICDTCAYGEHEHTVVNEWKSDADNHWHITSCTAHDAYIVDKAAHADENKDGLCDVCKYATCDHEWATTWSNDETGHWYAADCADCTAAKKDFAAHTDADKDGICDVCEYVVCTHTFSVVWTWDGENHWKDALCGCNVIGSNGAHTLDERGQCTVCGYEEHEHTFSETFDGSDETHHWREATCGCSMIKDRAEHTGREDDGACNVCGFGTHDHTWSDYKYNATEHYKETTCDGHQHIKSYAAAHTDINNDSICDTCGYDFGHTHTYDPSAPLMSDEKGHWNAPTCGHDVRLNYQDHNDFGIDYVCSTCGKATLKSVLNEVFKDEALNKVNGGTINMVDYADYGWLISETVNKISYEFGVDYTHIIQDGSEEFFEYWNHKLSNGNVFSLQHYIYGVQYDTDDNEYTSSEDYGILKNTMATAADLNGYAFSLSMIGNYGTYAYGPVGLIEALYNYALTSQYVTGNIESNIDDENHVYSFSAQFITGNGKYGTLKYLTVEFTTNDEYVLTSANVKFTTYSDPTDNPTAVDGKDYYLDSKGQATLLDGAAADNEFTVSATQTIGDRTATSPFNPAEILIGSYDIVDANGAVVDESYKHDMGTNVVFTMTNINPTTADLKYDVPEFGIEINNVAPWWFDYNWDAETGTLTFAPTKVGTYELTIKTSSGEEKYVYFEVVVPKTTELFPVVKGEETTSAEIYAGKDVTLSANAQNSYADANFTASCDDANLVLTLDETADGTIYTMSSAVTGTYTITLTSTSNSEVTTTLEITVVTPPDVTPSGVYSGYYEDWDWNSYEVEATFTPDSEGACTGTVVVVTDLSTGPWGSMYEAGVYETTYTYDGSAASLVLTQVGDGDQPVEVTVNDNLEIVFIAPDYEVTVMEYIGEAGGEDDKPTIDDLLSGKYTGYLAVGLGKEYDITVEFGTDTFSVLVEWEVSSERTSYKYEATYNYEYFADSNWVSTELVSGQLYSSLSNADFVAIDGECPVNVVINADDMAIKVYDSSWANSVALTKVDETDIDLGADLWYSDDGNFILKFDVEFGEAHIMDTLDPDTIIVAFIYTITEDGMDYEILWDDAYLFMSDTTITLDNGNIVIDMWTFTQGK